MRAETGKTRKREEAIAALIAHSTIAQAAKSCHVAESTLLRWLSEPEFSEAYRQARRQCVENAIGHLQQASGAAVETLLEVMKNPLASSSAKIASARSVLDYAFKGIELQDFEERLAAMEAALAEKEVT